MYFYLYLPKNANKTIKFLGVRESVDIVGKSQLQIGANFKLNFALKLSLQIKLRKS